LYDCGGRNCFENGSRVRFKFSDAAERFDIWLVGFCDKKCDYVIRDVEIAAGTIFTFTEAHHASDCYGCAGRK
jgi:hypothetical protein